MLCVNWAEKSIGFCECLLTTDAAFDSYLVYAAGVHSPGPLPMGLMPESGKGFAG